MCKKLCKYTVKNVQSCTLRRKKTFSWAAAFVHKRTLFPATQGFYAEDQSLFSINLWQPKVRPTLNNIFSPSPVRYHFPHPPSPMPPPPPPLPPTTIYVCRADSTQDK